MSIFGKIKAAIFGSAEAAPAKPDVVAQAAPAAPPAAPAPAAAAPSAAAPVAPAAPPKAPPVAPAPTAAPPAPSAATPAAPVDVAKVLTDLAAQHKEKLDWRRSIVDLMKLLDLDSSFAARKELAHELGYKGDTGDSATMNIWLHKQVMIKLAANGGKVPDELKD